MNEDAIENYIKTWNPVNRNKNRKTTNKMVADGSIGPMGRFIKENNGWSFYANQRMINELGENNIKGVFEQKYPKIKLHTDKKYKTKRHIA